MDNASIGAESSEGGDIVDGQCDQAFLDSLIAAAGGDNNNNNNNDDDDSNEKEVFWSCLPPTVARCMIEAMWLWFLSTTTLLVSMDIHPRKQ